MKTITERAYEHFPQPSLPEREAAIEYAINGLEALDPSASSRRPFVKWQVVVFIVGVALTVVGFVLDPLAAMTGLAATSIVVYLIAILSRLQVFIRGLRYNEERILPDPSTLTDEELPIYTILMPAYDEPAVIRNLVRATDAIDYPHDKLELILLIEEDDESTLSVLLRQDLPDPVRVLLIPALGPRTKPKACNYGLLFAKGEFVTIYDAEDIPSPEQLRLAVATFREEGEEIACLQGRLDYFNERQNLMTRWFTIEYTTWFACFLPGLDALRMPIPLGGTSNHIRTDLLKEIGAWDPYNVTEDADLGLRLARRGYRTGVLPSITLEEANSDAVNWVRQRSRWYKGYLQTWLVHFRNPRQAVKELGPKGAFAATMLIGLTPILAAINLFTWTCTIMFIIGVPPAAAQIFPSWVVLVGLATFLFGNLAVIYISILATTQAGKGRLAWACLVYPLYWLLMALAATKAVYQLIAKPSYWEKTAHGLTDEFDEEEISHQEKIEASKKSHSFPIGDA